MAFENLKSSSAATFVTGGPSWYSKRRESRYAENRGGYELCRIRVDGCLIVQGERCDYIPAMPE